MGEYTRTGKNHVLFLSGSVDYVEITNSESLNFINSQVTMEAWIKPTAFNDEWIPIIFKGDDFVNEYHSNRSYTLWINSSKRSIHLSSASTSIETPPGIIKLDQWYHIAGILDGKNRIMRIFINGFELASSNFGSSVNMSKLPLLIGWAYEEDSQISQFTGEIDEVRIWNLARSPEDIQKTMNNPLSGKEPGLVGYWNFDNDVGKVLDLSQSRADGKMRGNAHIIKTDFPKTELFDFAVIFGTVKDEAGKPVPRATVRLELNNDLLKWLRTDNSGKYYMIVKNPVNEVYEIFAISDKLGGSISNVCLHNGESKTIDFTIKESVSIEGNILMMDVNTPHTYVSVQLISDGKVIDSVLSDEKGLYRFIAIKSGNYQVRCQVPGGYIYYNDGKDLAVEEGKTLRNIDFRFPSFKKGIWRYYDTSDGLGDIRIHTIHQSPEGALWFGSGSFNFGDVKGSGVTRYDGKTFNIFTTRDGLINNAVWAICSEPDGTMWFGARKGGVSRYQNGKFTSFTEKDGLISNDVLAIHCSSDNNIWFGTSKGISRYDGKNITNFTFKDGLINNTVWAIESDSDGKLWFGTSSGVSVYDGERFETILEDELSGQRVCAIHENREGVMWIGTGYTWGDGIGVLRYDGREFIKFTTRDGLISNSVMSIGSTSDGVMWFGTNFGISSFYNNIFINFGYDKLRDNSIETLYISQDDSLWLGTGMGGVIQYDYKNFGVINILDGLPHNFVQSSYCDCSGRLWIGTRKGVALYNNCDHWRAPVIFNEKDGLGYDPISVIRETQNGKLWFGTGGIIIAGSGVYIYEDSNRRFTNLNTKDGLAHNRIFDISSDTDGKIWVLTSGGISIYDGKNFSNLISVANSIILGNISEVFSICRSSDNAIWIGTGGGGAVRYDGIRSANFTTKDGLIDDIVWAVDADTKGNIWFGTDTGVSKYDGKDFMSLQQDEILGNKWVHHIHCATDGIVWFGTYGGGVYGYDGQTWTSLDTEDGLSDNKVLSIEPDPNGNLWISTAVGLTRYCRSKTPPGVYIVSITTDKTYTDLSKIPPFSPGTRVTVKYNAIDFKTLPDKRQYRCRIKEIDENWQKPIKSELFDYVFDKPGTYTFEVQAIDRDLNYSQPVSIILTVVPDPRNHRIIQLEEHIRQQELAEMERIHEELEEARKIQRSLLPGKSPDIKNFDIIATSIPAREVSGDFYDYLTLGDNTGIVLADVTGKSVKAAMIATMTDGILHTAINDQKIWNSPKMILEQVNAGLQPRLMRGMYTALCLGILKPGEKQLILSNAGVPYPILKRGDLVRELIVNGMPLGLVDKVEYSDIAVDLKSGDFVIFCSDGVIEAVNKADEMYESERLLGLIQKANPGLSALDMMDLILKDVVEFAGNEASDDITVVVLKSI